MLRLGVIGTGIMGERMLRAAREHAADLVEISGVWDAEPSAAQRVATSLAGVAALGSADAVIEAAECVYVATPPASHLAYARQALAAGRAVFLEKPLAVDFAEAEAFTRRHAGDRVAVNFPFATSFAVEKLAAWIREGTLGAPRRLSIEVAFAAWPRRWQESAAAWLAAPAEGGFTREVVSHFLFLSRRLLGPLTLLGARAVFEPGGTEREIEARLEAAGVRGRLTGAVGQTQKEDHNVWTLEGVGSIRLRDWSFAERLRPNGVWVADPDALPNDRVRPLILRRQLEQVARMTKGEPHRLARLDEALDVQAVVESILRA